MALVTGSCLGLVRIRLCDVVMNINAKGFMCLPPVGMGLIACGETLRRLVASASKSDGFSRHVHSFIYTSARNQPDFFERKIDFDIILF